METEIEVKFCDVNKEELRQELKKAGAKLLHAEILMRRKAMDFPDMRLDQRGGWARVRDEGERVTMSYKQVNDRTLHGTKEVSVDVSDFNRAGQILEELGLVVKSYQETKREKWLLNNCEVTIDTWPWIPPMVEIEGGSEGMVRKTADELGFDWQNALHGSVESAYQRYYDVSEQEINRLPEIKFVDVPESLMAKVREIS